MRPADVVVVGRTGVDHDVLIGVERADQAGRLDPVAARHREVHDDEVRAVRARELHRLVARPRPADDLEASVFVQERCDQLRELVVVLGHDDAQYLDLHSAERDRSIHTMRR